jgi:hypothetical protein
MGAAAWTRKLARSFRPGCTEARAAHCTERALALSGPATASALPVTVVSSLRRAGGSMVIATAQVYSLESHIGASKLLTARVPS